MPIETNRSLGVIGALLSLLGIISTISNLVQYIVVGNTPSSSSAMFFGFLGVVGVIGILSFVGFIFFMISMYGFSRDYGERRIFSYLLYGLIVTIIAFVVIVVISIVVTMASLFGTFSNSNPPLSPGDFSSIYTPYLSVILVATSFVGLIWIIANYKSYNLMAEKSGVPLFSTSAKLLVLGTILNMAVLAAIFLSTQINQITDYGILSVAVAPGAFVTYASQAVLAMAFFRIKAPPPQTTAKSNVYSSNGPVKYCTYCGAPNQLVSTYCIRCGRKL